MASAPPPPLSFLLRHPAHLIACGFGSGLSPWAPGTAGTLFAWLAYAPLRELLPLDAAFGAFLLLAFALGIAACGIAGRALGVIDHGSIVWDEIVPFWAVLWLTPPTLAWQAAAFAAFRLFDITKPPPADYFDQRVKSGFGVMMDDTIAAAYAIFVVAAAKSAADGWW